MALPLPGAMPPPMGAPGMAPPIAPMGGPPMTPMGGPSLGGPSNDSFSVGMLAGLGLREFSQLFGLSKGNKSQSSAQPSAAAMMQGNMGDIDRQMVLAEMLKRQAAAAPPSGPGLPMGAGTPPGMPGGVPPQPAPMLPPGAAPGPMNPQMAMMLAARSGGPPPAPPSTPGGPVASALISQLLAKAMQARQGPI